MATININPPAKISRNTAADGDFLWKQDFEVYYCTIYHIQHGKVYHSPVTPWSYLINSALLPVSFHPLHLKMHPAGNSIK